MKKILLILPILTCITNIKAMEPIKLDDPLLTLMPEPRRLKYDLFAAIKNNDLVAAKKAIEAGVNVNISGHIFTAIKEKNLPMVQLLVESGAKLKTMFGLMEEYSPRTPLDYAAQYGNLEIVKFLSKKGGLYKYSYKEGINGISPLYSAILAKNFEIAEFLEKNGARLSEAEIEIQVKLDNQFMKKLKSFKKWKLKKQKQHKQKLIDEGERTRDIKRKKGPFKTFTIQIKEGKEGKEGKKIIIPGKGFLQ